MALGDLAGRARARPNSPEAMGECDSCGFWYPLSRLQKQFQWAGAALVDTGYLVCTPKCLDIPFEQNRVLILPPDPVPRINPRVSYDVTAPYPATSPGNQGFSQYVLGGATPGLYPTTKSAVLSQVASLSGIPTPGGITDRSITITPANTTLSLVPPKPGRAWLLVYNPVQAQAQISLQTATWGAITNLIIGPGEAYFWATAQNFGTVYQGAMTAIGLNAPLPLWAWDF